MQCCFAVLRFQRIQISNQLLASSKSKIIKVYESFLSNILNNVLASPRSYRIFDVHCGLNDKVVLEVQKV